MSERGGQFLTVMMPIFVLERTIEDLDFLIDVKNSLHRTHNIFHNGVVLFFVRMLKTIKYKSLAHIDTVY